MAHKKMLVLDLLTQLPYTFFGKNWYQNTSFKHFTTEAIFLKLSNWLEKWVSLNLRAEGETSVVEVFGRKYFNRMYFEIILVS